MVSFGEGGVILCYLVETEGKRNLTILRQLFSIKVTFQPKAPFF